MDNQRNVRIAAQIFDLYAKFWKLDVLFVDREDLLKITGMQTLREPRMEDFRNILQFHFYSAGLYHLVTGSSRRSKITHFALSRVAFTPQQEDIMNDFIHETSRMRKLDATGLYVGKANFNYEPYDNNVRTMKSQLLMLASGDMLPSEFKLLWAPPDLPESKQEFIAPTREWFEKYKDVFRMDLPGRPELVALS